MSRTTATQLLNALGWLSRRHVEIKRITTRGRPFITINKSCPELTRRATEIRESCYQQKRIAYVARLQGCIIHWYQGE